MSHAKRKIAFIGHPLNMTALSVMTGFPRAIMDVVGKNRIKTLLMKCRPFVFARQRHMVSRAGAVIDFMAIACPYLPEQLVAVGEEKALRVVLSCVELAEREGADLVCLGGFTSVVGNEGEEISKRSRIAVTSGNTYTAGLAVEGVVKAAETLGVGMSKSKLAIVGASGDIGSACVRMLADKFGEVALVARDRKKLTDLVKAEFGGPGRMTVYERVKDAVTGADMIITATSALTTIIDSYSLKQGSVVCDVALPANIAKEISRLRKDVFAFEGGLAKFYSGRLVTNRKCQSLMPSGSMYGCVAEGLILGFSGKIENYSIGRGRITNFKIHEIMQLAEEHGFCLADYFCGDRYYSGSDIRFIQQRIQAPSMSEVA